MSFFRYPGGKAKLREKITRRLIPMLRRDGAWYCEPFVGGGGIGLSLLSSGVKRIWINDADIGVSCLWTSVTRYPNEFKKRVREFVPSVPAFHGIRSDLSSPLPSLLSQVDIVDVGFKKLAIHQMSYSGLGMMSGGPLGGKNQESRYKIDCRWSPEYICKKVDKLHAALSSIDVYEDGCTNLDFATVLGGVSDDAVVYLDPPYYVKGNDLYQCGFSAEDHARLASHLSIVGWDWLLSYDDCVAVRNLYGWANIESLSVNYSITATRNGRSRVKSELLIDKTHRHTSLTG